MCRLLVQRLGEQPAAKSLHGGPVGPDFGHQQKIGVTLAHSNVKRSHQSTLCEGTGHQRLEGQRHSQPIQRGHIGHARIAEVRPSLGVDTFDTGLLEPFVPGRAGAHAGDGFVMQQHLVAHVVWHTQRWLAGQQFRAAHGDVVCAKHAFNLKTWVVAVAKPDHHQGILGLQLHLVFKADQAGRLRTTNGFVGTDDMQVDVRVCQRKTAQPWHQPAGGKRRRHHHHQAPRVALGAGTFHGGGKAIQTFTHFGQHRQTLRREFQGTGQTGEQLQIQRLFQQLDLVADGRGRDR